MKKEDAAGNLSNSFLKNHDNRMTNGFRENSQKTFFF
jgi:hypothetical protein